MQYVLIVHGNHAAWNSLTDQQRQRFYAEHEELMASLQRSGVSVTWGCSLAPKKMAIIRAAEDGTRLTEPDHSTESGFQTGGIYAIEVENHDDAVDWATKIPLLPDGGSMVEVRVAEQVICPADSQDLG